MSNIDSRRASSEQHRFKNPLARIRLFPKAVMTSVEIPQRSNEIRLLPVLLKRLQRQSKLSAATAMMRAIGMHEGWSGIDSYAIQPR